jgi:hypothetical protein
MVDPSSLPTSSVVANGVAAATGDGSTTAPAWSPVGLITTDRDLRRLAQRLLPPDAFGHETWVGALADGAGVVRWADGRRHRAARLLWHLRTGQAPSGRLVRWCDRPLCVAPAHHLDIADRRAAEAE